MMKNKTWSVHIDFKPEKKSVFQLYTVFFKKIIITSSQKAM